MADEIEIVDLTPEHIHQVESWAERNEAANTLFKASALNHQNLPSRDKWGWAAIKDNKVLAIATIELNNNRVGYFNCIVKPSEQRQNIGTQIVDYAMKQSSVKNLTHLHSTVDPSNVAAQKILNNYEFTKIGSNAEGKLEFARHVH